jgi:hypothetical protein
VELEHGLVGGGASQGSQQIPTNVKARKKGKKNVICINANGYSFPFFFHLFSIANFHLFCLKDKSSVLTALPVKNNKEAEELVLKYDRVLSLLVENFHVVEFSPLR